MKRAILTILLAAASTGAMAEWVQVGSSEEYIYYADPATIRKNGAKVKMWHLRDNKEPKPFVDKVYRSLRIQGEFDCSNETSRHLHATFFEREMAQGKILHLSDSPSAWQPVAPGSTGEAIWGMACGKVKPQ